ncbi:hypothetical protein ASG39_04915 [Rhizobium sp. Leaf371]|uniref:GNAT family N-acetyltransferase n=1 Tax=Rhizobium sp. Leaf371 TaxID=1736355 RepID=UPI0007163747|nr:GNAT family N-acetyltransferase [Rhizobium sp. Leaf371]KQS67729.1 hypothetical protein ASG39_04915 [Rhizobium sp. Leaf371]
MKISNLKHQPGFASIIADRAWNAWWTESGVTLEDYRAHLDPMIGGTGVPFALVAHRGDTYAGSVLVIEHDHDARPQYSPWIAALWVEPEFRRQGLAARLLTAARSEAATDTVSCCYLCAAPDKQAYYLKQGFRLIESNVNGLDIFVIGEPLSRER